MLRRGHSGEEERLSHITGLLDWFASKRQRWPDSRTVSSSAFWWRNLIEFSLFCLNSAQVNALPQKAMMQRSLHGNALKEFLGAAGSFMRAVERAGAQPLPSTLVTSLNRLGLFEAHLDVMARNSWIKSR
jgi:hypothetical protein